MTITKIEAENFRAFKSLKAEFKRPFTILCGGNGSGKSSILYAIAHGLVLSGNESGLTEECQLRLSFTNRDEQEEESGFGKGSFELQNYQKSKQKVIAMYKDSEGIKTQLFVQDRYKSISPLFIGPNRSISYKSIAGMTKENDCDTSRQLCLSSAMAKLSNTSVPDIKQWMVNRYFTLGKGWAATEEANWNLVMSKLDILTEAGVDFKFNDIQRDLEPSFFVNGKKTYLEELSSGFKSVLAMVFSIVEWIEQTNENEEASITVAKGTVLIDEIDAHLHPSWQLRIKGILEELFPNIQFIVTTHSPHVISSAGAGEVGILENHDGHLTVNFVDKDITTWKTDYIYSDIMDFEPVSNSKLAEYVDVIEDKIDQGDMAGALEVLEEYAEKAHSEDFTPKALKRQIEKLQKRMAADD